MMRSFATLWDYLRNSSFNISHYLSSLLLHSRMDIPMQTGRDIWWHDLLACITPSELGGQVDCCPIEWCDAEDSLFMLYTSGSTGRPKGVLHTLGGYMVYTGTTFYYTFDYHADDIYWCTADVGWITGPYRLT
ncbi:unnamed protein product [Protopolystoma xenopodis]|uniref:acetate--CoA ligase n=1 Tax=Protopolystoma xenopodis TaxID=117903 RepID=A0A3S5ATA3_9PLAT|nr:unnamed protein product [Protopolystoma xenopodis]